MRLADCSSALFRVAAMVPCPIEAAPAREVDKPLLGLAGSHLAERFRHWRGLSGRRYLFSVFPLPHPQALDHLPCYDETVILAVRRSEDGARTILMAADTGFMPDVVLASQAMRQALDAGANEIHMHLLAEDAEWRQAMVEDLE